MKKNIHVIHYGMPSVQAVWRFWDYGTHELNLFDAWYSSQSEEARDQIDGILKNCCNVADHQQWLSFKRFLKGKYAACKIWEMRFKSDKREYRILGIFGTKRKECILLMGCYHKGSNYTPAAALDIAFDRAKNFKLGIGELRERKIRTDL